MKLTVYLKAEEEVKNVNTINFIRKWVYENLGRVNPVLARWLHDEGIVVNKVRIKPLNFSTLRKMRNGSNIYYVKISSPHNETVLYLIKAFLKPTELRLESKDGKKYILQPFDLEIREYERGKNEFCTLSPILLRKKENGKTCLIDLPVDSEEDIEEVRKLIEVNLFYKYMAIHGKECRGKIDRLEPVDLKNGFITYHDLENGDLNRVYVRGYVGRFRLYGDEELLELAYYNGIGGKNACGFGCIEILPVLK